MYVCIVVNCRGTVDKLEETVIRNLIKIIPGMVTLPI